MWQLRSLKPSHPNSSRARGHKFSLLWIALLNLLPISFAGILLYRQQQWESGLLVLLLALQLLAVFGRGERKQELPKKEKLSALARAHAERLLKEKLDDLEEDKGKLFVEEALEGEKLNTPVAVQKALKELASQRKTEEE